MRHEALLVAIQASSVGRVGAVFRVDVGAAMRQLFGHTVALHEANRVEAMTERDKPMVKMMPAWAKEAEQLLQQLQDTEDTNLKQMYHERLKQLIMTGGKR